MYWQVKRYAEGYTPHRWLRKKKECTGCTGYVIHRIGGLEMSSRDLFNIFDVIHRIGGLETVHTLYIPVIHRIGGLEMYTLYIALR